MAQSYLPKVNRWGLENLLFISETVEQKSFSLQVRWKGEINAKFEM